METKIETNEESSSFLKKRKRLVMVSFFFFILAVLLLILFFYYQAITSKQRMAEREAKSKDDWIASTLRDQPEGVQNAFADDVKNGVNDQYTKADAYWITHRYFDTSGDIYEIYDYVNSRPQLAFLEKEAEAIYPDIFERLKKRDVPVATDSARLACLAYIEALKNHGYTDIAGLGTAANQYAKTAYFAQVLADEIADRGRAEARAIRVKRNIEKAIEFEGYSRDSVQAVLDGKVTDKDVPARDILVGLNQYAGSLRYLEALGVKQDSPRNAKEIFAFALEYSRKNVPQLLFFTSLLDASTLAISNPENPQELKEALYPILNFDTKKNKLSDQSILNHVIDARFEPTPLDIESTPLDIYSRRNVVRLASRVNAFRLWLVENGWTEEDFKKGNLTGS